MLVAAGLISIAWWLARDPVADLVATQPGLDNRGAKAVVPDIKIVDYYEVLAPEGRLEPDTGLEETWPRFRGEFFE